MTGAKDDGWTEQARNWNRFSGPLRPHPDDTAIVARNAAELAGETDSLFAVMLGVTPETAGCAWPARTRLRAFDSSPEIIQRLWPPANAPRDSSAECADWTALPVNAGEADLIAADGSLTCLGYPEGAEAVVAEMRRILRPGGRFIARTFVRPEEGETIEQILADLDEGRIGGPWALKQRVGAALHDAGLAGLSLRRMWLLWQELFPDVPAAADRLGWPAASLAMPNPYDPVDVRITYPTVAELRALLAPHFVERECRIGSYELAERCPTMVLEPR